MEHFSRLMTLMLLSLLAVRNFGRAEPQDPTKLNYFPPNFRAIPAGTYTVSVYAWFANKTDVPCQHPQEGKTADDGDVTVEWQYKSRAFMEIVTIKGFVVSAGQRVVKDFDIFCR